MRPSLEPDSDGLVTRPNLKAIIALFAGLLVLMKRLFLKRKRAAALPTAVSKEMVMDLSDGDPYAAQDDYDARKRSLLDSESRVAWDAAARATASLAEKRAQTIVFKIREDERVFLFGNVATEAIPDSQTRDMGGQFLTNKDRIMKSKIYRMAQKMPKGCHLHLHFNAELMEPNYFIDEARKNPNMYARSTRPILVDLDYDEAEIVFNVLPSSTVEADIFSPAYKPEFRAAGATPWMKWSKFRAAFRSPRGESPEKWIRRKLVLTEEEVYGINQTTNGIWARFNQATRCFKGLVNYESIYRLYVKKAIESMINEKVMYAELRPMLMDKTIPSDNGEEALDHQAQMRIILEVVEALQTELASQGRLDEFPFGLKIIYCAPRSIPKKMMQREIDDCIDLKQRFPNLICGFDLVGAEDRPNHIGFYRDELLAMQARCRALGLDLPFLFHAGETLLDTGGSVLPRNSNLYDAVLFGARRVGHGFSLLKHPVLVDEFRRKRICIELCPTSNELLHLCRNIKEHPFPQILAAGIPCTVNSDNTSLFGNSLSFEFYQIMVGSTAMTLHGWRQLAEWSIEFSCLSEPEKAQAVAIFRRDWEAFCEWIDAEFGAHADGLAVAL